MHLIEKLVNILCGILASDKNRERLIFEFQKIVWDFEEAPVQEEIWDVLGELAYDLDFYEPDTEIRAEDPSYYGNERVEEEIRLALKKLEKLNIQIPIEL